MLGGKEVYRSIKLNDNIKTSSLSVMDQVRLIFSKISNDDAAELDTNEKLTKDKLQRVAALTDLLDKATKREQFINTGCVTLRVSSEFLPYVDEVVDGKRGIGRFYNVTVFRQTKMAGVKHFFVIQIRKKGDE